MQHVYRLMVLALVIGGLHLAACQETQSKLQAEHPATIEKIEGSDLSRVILTEKAVGRLDLKTDRVGDREGQSVVPYSSLIYDPQGGTWVYTSPAANTFLRQRVEVDRIEGDVAVLKDGPAVGTVVASVAVAELYGAETKVGH